ncbi:hypothetical protein EDC96DRAFT_548404 [Choanephora cucurbitarum]|nr:hypothetical protein EDC96DRAFT_548404 [Choanephora cucurbitarum]
MSVSRLTKEEKESKRSKVYRREVNLSRMQSATQKSINVNADKSRPKNVALVALISKVDAVVVDTIASFNFKLDQLNSFFADLGISGKKKTEKRNQQKRGETNHVELGFSHIPFSTTSPVSITATVFSISHLTTSCLWLL